MATLLRYGRVFTLNRLMKRYANDMGLVRISTTAVRRYWNRDWKPANYPRTEEERRAAAEKYYMLPEDYVPYDDDGTGLGDYPKLPEISADNRDPFEDYDFPVLRRNYCEPLHHQFDMLTETRYNNDPKMPKPFWWLAMCFFGAVGASIAFYFISIPFELARPALPKQYPKDGAKHYTFEPISSE